MLNLKCMAMKTKLLFLMSCLSVYLGSCTQVDIQQDLSEISSRSVSTSAQEIVYDQSNWPDFSEQIAHIKAVSVEEPTLTNNMQSRTLTTLTYGPWGGDGGNAFSAPLTLATGEAWKKIYAIKVRHGKIIDAIQLYWVNDSGVYTNSPHYGGDTGTESWMFLASNEYITKLTVRAGNKVDKLVFTTNLNKTYTFGGDGGDATTLNFGTSGLQMHGIYGRSGGKIDRIGIYCYPNSMFGFSTLPPNIISKL